MTCMTCTLHHPAAALSLPTPQAAAFMRSIIADAYDKWTTGFYDYIQSLQVSMLWYAQAQAAGHAPGMGVKSAPCIL